MKEWICQEEPLIREDGARIGVGFRQMVELVRCKDCKYWKNGYLNYVVHEWLPCMEVKTTGDWFCADGEKADT